MKTFIAAIALVSGVAFAQRNDAPIPFENETPSAPLPRHQKPADTDNFSDYVQHEESSFKTLAHEDDPTTGISLDLHLGYIELAESKKGSSGRFTLGLRGTWEWSRAFFDDEYWRKVFFVDLTWNITMATAGTDYVYTKVTHNYLALAPAWSHPFSLGGIPLAVFVQGGIGLFFLNSTLTVGSATTSNSGVYLLGQYGLGVRSRISLDPKKAFFIVARLEFTGYIHRHTHDFLLSAGVGLGF